MVTNHPILNVKKKAPFSILEENTSHPKQKIYYCHRKSFLFPLLYFQVKKKKLKKKKDSKGSQQTKALFPLLLPGSRLQGLVFYTK